MEENPLYEKAQVKAFRLLRYRGRSTAELRSRLKDKGFSENIIEKVIDRLSELKYLDDDLFALEWARSCAVNKLWGDRKIFLSLQEKGIHAEVIEKSIKEARKDLAETEAIERIMEKRFRKRDPSIINVEKERNRLTHNLMGRGFPTGLIFDAVGKIEEFITFTSGK